MVERELHLDPAHLPVPLRRGEAERREATKLADTPTDDSEEGAAHERTYAESTRRRRTEGSARRVRPHVVSTTSAQRLAFRCELKPRIAPVSQRLTRVHITNDPCEPPPHEASEESVPPLAASREAPRKSHMARRECERLRLECAGHYEVSAGRAPGRPIPAVTVGGFARVAQDAKSL